MKRPRYKGLYLQSQAEAAALGRRLAVTADFLGRAELALSYFGEQAVKRLKKPNKKGVHQMKPPIVAAVQAHLELNSRLPGTAELEGGFVAISWRGTPIVGKW